MWRVPLFGFEHRRLVLSTAALLTMASWLALPGLRLDVSSDTVVAPGTPQYEAERRIEARFGKDESAAIYAEDRELFTVERLAALRTIAEELSRLPFVERVDSLFSLADVREEDGALVLGAPLAEIPVARDAIAALRAAILANPTFAGTLVAEDGSAALLRIVIAESSRDRLQVDDEFRRDEIERILGTSRDRFEHLEQIGGPASRTAMRQRLTRDQRLILPATALLLFVLLAIGMRSTRLALLPLVNGALATIWGLAAMAALDIPVTLLSASLPALVIVVGGMEDVRIAQEFRAGLRRHGLPRLALFETAERVGLATLLNSGTTVIGFAATAASGLPVLRDFGAASAVALGFRLLCTVVVLPAELSLFVGGMRARSESAVKVEPGRLQRFVAATFVRLTPRFRVVVTVLAIICVGGAVAATRLPRQNDYLGFLGAHDPLVLQTQRVESRLAGTEILSVELDAAPGEFARPAALSRLAGLTDALRALPGVDSALSLGDVVARVHGQLRAGDAGAGKLPATDRELAQLLLLVTPEQLAPFVTADRASARIVLRTSIHDATRLEALAAAVSERVESEEFGRHLYAVGGRALTLAGAATAITRSQVSSLAVAVLVMFAIVSCLFLSIRCGAVAVLVNLVAVMMVFVLMRALSIPLNIGTCMVASVTLGLVMDDTLHLLVRYSRALRVHRDEAAGIQAVVAEAIGPMFASAGALAGGLAMLGWSEFVPVRQFGLLSALVVILAVITESIASPVLFGNTRIVTLWDLISHSLRRTLLDESPLFAGLSHWQARRLVLASDAENFRAGEVIVRADDPGHTLYVVLDGEVEIVRGGEGKPQTIARLGVGDVFGEVALLAEVPRTADAVAATDVRALVMTRASLESLRRFSPYLASQLLLNLTAIMARRLQPAGRSEGTTPS